MMKKLIYILCFYSMLSVAYSAGTEEDKGNEEREADITVLKGSKIATEYEKAVYAIYKAKKLDKKGKTKKAKKKYQIAYDFLIKANNVENGNPDILNYLGFASRKLEKLEDAEIYYLLGLDQDPYHIGINKYLGELYLETNRIDKAKERLKVLENCKCKEFKELKILISKS